MHQKRARAWPWPVAIVALVVILVGLGALLDLMAGAQVAQGTQAWTEWLLWMLGLGGLYLLLEAAAEWIERRDASNSLAKLRATTGLNSVWMSEE